MDYIDATRLLPRYRQADTDTPTQPILRRERGRAAAGDPYRLRLIPVIGGGGGAIPGTRPTDAIHRLNKPLDKHRSS